MNKGKKLKTLLGIGFVAICGTVYLWGSSVKKREVVVPKSDMVPVAEEPMQEEDNVSEKMQDESPEPFLYVHVCGAVEKEGVYVLLQESRVIDAVTEAGGFSEDADTTYYNLAALLKDGQRVYIPTRKETQQLSAGQKGEGAFPEDGLQREENETAVNAKVNINTADKETLMTLSGIGETKADSILLYRRKVGKFRKIEEIKNVTGIGDAMFERIKDSITAE